MSDVLLSYWLIDCQIGFLRSKPQHSHNGHNFCKQKPSCLIIRLLFVIFYSKTFKPSWHLFPRVTAPRRAAVCWWASRPRERKRFQKRSSPLKANLPGWLGRLRCTRIFASILFFAECFPRLSVVLNIRILITFKPQAGSGKARIVDSPTITEV